MLLIVSLVSCPRFQCLPTNPFPVLLQFITASCPRFQYLATNSFTVLLHFITCQLSVLQYFVRFIQLRILNHDDNSPTKYLHSSTNLSQ